MTGLDTSRRAALEDRFQPHVMVNVGAQVQHDHPVVAEAACDELSLWLLEAFQPDWEAVTANPGGTAGHHAAYLQAKADWLAHYLPTDQRDSPQAAACLDRLQAFWREWAGDQLTTGE